MSSIETRIRKVESAIGQGSREAGARDLVSFCQEVGLIGPGEDIQKLVADFTNNGATLAGILREIDGTTLGPPSQREIRQ
ncbi:MAG: hypothetical protein WC405_07155 [Syntrophales bacterium]